MALDCLVQQEMFSSLCGVEYRTQLTVNIVFGILLCIGIQADMLLNLLKRRGQGSLDVRQPRFSGLQGESLDLAARWSGDVVCK